VRFDIKCKTKTKKLGNDLIIKTSRRVFDTCGACCSPRGDRVVARRTTEARRGGCSAIFTDGAARASGGAGGSRVLARRAVGAHGRAGQRVVSASGAGETARQRCRWRIVP